MSSRWFEGAKGARVRGASDVPRCEGPANRSKLALRTFGRTIAVPHLRTVAPSNHLRQMITFVMMPFGKNSSGFMCRCAIPC